MFRFVLLPYGKSHPVSLVLLPCQRQYVSPFAMWLLMFLKS